jgi:hypothetical protein
LLSIDSTMGDMRYIGFPDLKTLYGIPYSWAHLARLEETGEFPCRVRLSMIVRHLSLLSPVC